VAEAVGQIRVEASIGTAKYVAGAKQIKAETASLERDIKTRFTGIGARVKGGIAGLVGALSVGAFVQIGRAALDYASKLGDVSQQLGLTTRDLQTFRYAAGQLGVSQGELEKGLENLTKTLGKVAVGAEKPAKALEAIGLNAQAVARMDTGDAFRAISDALAKVADRTQRAAVEFALFGETGARLDTMLAGGSAALNELAAAADELGIVLSDEQIQKADETADKLEALKTVLQARIAGVVADNADSILGLADAIGVLVKVIGDGLGYIQAFKNALAGLEAGRNSIFEQLLGRTVGGEPVQRSGQQRFGGLFRGRAAAPRGVDVGDFLAKTPRAGRSRRARTPRDDSARDLFRFEQDELRAQIDILRAKQQLATDYSDRTSLAVEILDLERASYENDLRFQVSQKDLTQAQADRLLLLHADKDALERQALLREEEEQRQREFTRLSSVTFDIQQNALQAQAQLAETAQERRDIELRLLNLAYRHERETLERIMRESQDYAEIEEARRRLAGLDAQFSLDRQGVIASTRGPMEDYLASLPTTAAKAQEALERLQVQGFEGLIDSVIALSDGLDRAGETLLQTVRNFLLGMARMELQRGLGSLMQNGGIAGLFKGAFGGGIGGGTSAGDVLNSGIYPDLGFANGGSFRVRGFGGIDSNIMSINGLPIARVSYGERVSVSPTNDTGSWRGDRGGVTMYVTTPDANSFRRSEGQITRGLQRRLAGA
jgi:hypothetical protein